jgi:hypothetical protein
MSHQIIWELQGHLIMPMLELEEIFIVQEEPWPPHGSFTGKGISQTLKQQAEISGAFLGGLIRWGYTNIAQISSTRWRMVVAEDLGITIHHTKWRSPELALKYNCKPADSGKFRAKQWAMGAKFPNEIPDFPDIIERPGGKIPRPEGSKAKAVQPADEYDALAIAWSFYLELRENEEIFQQPKHLTPYGGR